MTAEFINALDILKEWISQNEAILETKQGGDGQQTAESEILKFNVHPISNNELEEIKAFTQHTLPEAYYHFLSEIGSGKFFIGEYLPCFEFYNLADFRSIMLLFSR